MPIPELNSQVTSKWGKGRRTEFLKERIIQNPGITQTLLFCRVGDNNLDVSWNIGNPAHQSRNRNEIWAEYFDNGQWRQGSKVQSAKRTLPEQSRALVSNWVIVSGAESEHKLSHYTRAVWVQLINTWFYFAVLLPIEKNHKHWLRHTQSQSALCLTWEDLRAIAHTRLLSPNREPTKDLIEVLYTGPLYGNMNANRC